MLAPVGDPVHSTKHQLVRRRLVGQKHRGGLSGPALAWLQGEDAVGDSYPPREVCEGRGAWYPQVTVRAEASCFFLFKFCSLYCGAKAWKRLLGKHAGYLWKLSMSPGCTAESATGPPNHSRSPCCGVRLIQRVPPRDGSRLLSASGL